MSENYQLDPRQHSKRRDLEEEATDIGELLNRNRGRKRNFSKEDVATEPLVLTMEKFRFVKFPDSPEKKLKIYFSDYEHPYISNKLNMSELAIMFQSTSLSEWAGEKVCFYLDPTVTMEDEVTGGIRVCLEGQIPEHVVAFYESLQEDKGGGEQEEQEEQEAHDISEAS